ncbi:hypothetical protein [Thioalkalivibrio sp. XN8]|uniref:hypothetical protein n=1 Tax=Thioalkalivibrio sp. XN8 TaxID=2712863 RepID=UPI0013EB4B6C|nr:hypothetical protein [Thioalkalivibrio sp. XN8]NGP52890.1 hypothetical protein [Thioalkalivibrio sp. XN8]
MNDRKRIALTFVSAMALCAASIATAQEEAESHMLSILEIQVKAGHDSDFRAGLAAWKECYLANDGEGSWNLWRRQQGMGNVYAAVFQMKSWADVDTPDAASQACQEVARDQIIPFTHGEKTVNSYASSMPDISRAGPSGDVLWVSSFRAKDGRLMMDVVRKVSAAMKQVEGDSRGYWYDVAGGHEKAPDFFVSTPFENFAALDQERDGVWDIVTKVHGAEESERLRADFMKSMDAGWSYIYRRVPDLSHSQ